MSSTTTLAEVDEAVAEVTKRLLDGAPRVVVTGPPAAGKSSVLARLTKVPSDAVVIRLNPPVHDADAGAVALSSLAAGVESWSPGLVQSLRRPGTWADKLATVLATVRRKADKLVVLLDEPLAGSSSGPVDRPFGERVAELARELWSINGLRTVSTSTFWNLKQEVVPLKGRSDRDEILDPKNWGILGPAALTVGKADKKILESLSPLDLRLRVALVDSGMKAEYALRPRSIPGSIEVLFKQLGESGSALKKVVGSLAVFRLPFDPSVLEAFGPLDDHSRTLLTSALLFEATGRLRLHEAIAEAAKWEKWLSAGELKKAHDIAAAYYKGSYGKAAQVGDLSTGVREEMEWLYHRTESGDGSLLVDESLWFSDQYVGLGYRLSLDKRREEAGKAYARAIEHDEKNAYAHHYLAWNLDIRGHEARQVEQHYRRAAELAPEHAWYQGRFINFLIARGREREARAAWDAALASVFSVYDRGDVRVYEELHKFVARLLLHRGLLDFAADVLDDIPKAIRDLSFWAIAEVRLLEGLQAAARQQLVQPARLAPDKRWKPQLFRPEHVPETARWMAGHVDSVSGDEIHIRIGWLEQNEPHFAWLHLPMDEAKKFFGYGTLPAAGTFIEVVEQADGMRQMRQIEAPFADDALPWLFPRPDRYLKHDAASAD